MLADKIVCATWLNPPTDSNCRPFDNWVQSSHPRQWIRLLLTTASGAICGSFDFRFCLSV